VVALASEAMPTNDVTATNGGVVAKQYNIMVEK